MKDVTMKARKTDRENIHGKTEVITKADGEITRSMVLEYTCGLMEGNTREIG